MEIEDRIKILIEKGYTCDPIIGKVYGINGKEIKSKSGNGYYKINLRHKEETYTVYHHQFIYYSKHGTIPSLIDHINMDGMNNRIENLRASTKQKNGFNTKAKGYSFDKHTKKWRSHINVNYKKICLGRFDNEEDARQAYLNAKKIYHII